MLNRSLWMALFLLSALSTSSCKPIEPKPNKPEPDSTEKIISISKAHPRYFVNAKGETWIPISTNYLPENNFTEVESYFRKFAENGGNSMRIWISTDFLEIEDEAEGKYNPMKFQRIDKLLELAAKYRIYIKFTLHHIRTITNSPSPSSAWANSLALTTKFNSIEDYVNTAKGRRSYLNRARALAARYKNNEQIIGWELWNEVDAVMNEAGWKSFTPQILDSVKRIFPRQLITQTLGSMHAPYAEQFYYKLSQMPQNDFLSVHRYLDEGNRWNQYEFVKGAIDILAANAVSVALDFTKRHPVPVLINEIGAVADDHAGPSPYYANDVHGILLHDMIFAPFFAGAAGAGSTWHWNHYINPQNLWYHFKRFQTAIKGIDPVKEKLEPFSFTEDNVRCYALHGQTQTIIWCRDMANNWKTELKDAVPAAEKSGFTLSLANLKATGYSSCKMYDPWTDKWTENIPPAQSIAFPPFLRSMVVVLKK